MLVEGGTSSIDWEKGLCQEGILGTTNSLVAEHEMNNKSTNREEVLLHLVSSICTFLL